jgi:hypothetical protein
MMHLNLSYGPTMCLVHTVLQDNSFGIAMIYFHRTSVPRSDTIEYMYNVHSDLLMIYVTIQDINTSYEW